MIIRSWTTISLATLLDFKTPKATRTGFTGQFSRAVPAAEKIFTMNESWGPPLRVMRGASMGDISIKAHMALTLIGGV